MISHLTATAAMAGSAVQAADPDEMKIEIDNALPIAGLFVLVLGVAIFFLWKSMSKQIKRIDPTLPAGRDDAEQARDRALTDDAVERGAAADAVDDPDDAAGR